MESSQILLHTKNAICHFDVEFFRAVALQFFVKRVTNENSTKMFPCTNANNIDL